MEIEASDRTPLEIITYLYKSKAKFFHIVVGLRDVPGALADFILLLAKSNLNILGGSISGARRDDEERAYEELYRSVGLFVEAKDPHISIRHIHEIISGSPYTFNVKIHESKEGTIVNSLDFPIRLSQGQRVILFRKEVITASMREMRQVFNTGGDVMLFKQGYVAGKNDAEELLRIFGQDNVLGRLDELVNLYSAIGWGKASIIDLKFDSFSATVSIEDNFECVGQKTARPYSQFVRGHLAGLASVLFSVEMRCEEVKCTAMGDRQCEFVLSVQ